MKHDEDYIDEQEQYDTENMLRESEAKRGESKSKSRQQEGRQGHAHT